MTVIFMKKLLLIYFIFILSSIAYASFDEVIYNRIQMFKFSGASIKELRSAIRAKDTEKAIEAVAFHINWSEKMKEAFPLGSHASTTNGSDASADIWRNFKKFEQFVNGYTRSARDLNDALKREDIYLIVDRFQDLANACKDCHKSFRN